MKMYTKRNIGVDREIIVTPDTRSKELIICLIHTDMEMMETKKACSTVYASVEGVGKCIEEKKWIQDSMIDMLCGRYASGSIALSESTYLQFDTPTNTVKLWCRSRWTSIPVIINLKPKEMDKLLGIFQKWYKHMQSDNAQ